MTDPSQPGQPSEEEIRAYMAQIREADPTAIIVQAYQMLGEGAQIKLGRPDARVLIDAMAAVTDAVTDKIQAELAEQMRQGVAQLQAAQVQQEQQEQQQAGEAAQGAPSTTPGSGASGMPEGQPVTSSPRQQTEEEKLTDRLWIPGRGPKPGP